MLTVALTTVADLLHQMIPTEDEVASTSQSPI